jgi:hypothetical protein
MLSADGKDGNKKMNTKATRVKYKEVAVSIIMVNSDQCSTITSVQPFRDYRTLRWTAATLRSGEAA